MDSIASYASSDSESDSSDSEKKNKMGLSSKRQVLDQQEIQQNRQSKKKLPVLTGKDRGSMVPPISLRHESCIMSTDNLQKYNSIGFELTKDSTVNSISTSNNILKPYIPKSKRKKLANESESVDKSVHTCSKNFPSKLSTIFQRAEPFSQTASLRYRVPKGQLSDFEGHQGCVNRISWNPCFVDFLLSGSMDSVVKVWNVQTSPCCVYNVRSHQQAVKDAKWSHDGLQILSCGYDKMARITDINLGIYFHLLICISNFCSKKSILQGNSRWFLFGEGPMLETLDYTIRIGRTDIFIFRFVLTYIYMSFSFRKRSLWVQP